MNNVQRDVRRQNQKTVVLGVFAVTGLTALTWLWALGPF